MGSGGPSHQSLLRAFDITREKGPKKLGLQVFQKSCAAPTLQLYQRILKLKV